MLIRSCGSSRPVHRLVVLLVVQGGWLTSLTVIVHLSVFALDFIHFYFAGLPVRHLVPAYLGLLCFDRPKLLLSNSHLSPVVFLLWALLFLTLI